MRAKHISSAILLAPLLAAGLLAGCADDDRTRVTAVPIVTEPPPPPPPPPPPMPTEVTDTEIQGVFNAATGATQVIGSVTQSNTGARVNMLIGNLYGSPTLDRGFYLEKTGGDYPFSIQLEYDDNFELITEDFQYLQTRYQYAEDNLSNIDAAGVVQNLGENVYMMAVFSHLDSGVLEDNRNSGATSLDGVMTDAPFAYGVWAVVELLPDAESGEPTAAEVIEVGAFYDGIEVQTADLPTPADVTSAQFSGNAVGLYWSGGHDMFSNFADGSLLGNGSNSVFTADASLTVNFQDNNAHTVSGSITNICINNCDTDANEFSSVSLSLEELTWDATQHAFVNGGMGCTDSGGGTCTTSNGSWGAGFFTPDTNSDLVPEELNGTFGTEATAEGASHHFLGTFQTFQGEIEKPTPSP